MVKMQQPILWMMVIFLTIAIVVCLSLEIYMGALFFFGVPDLLAIGLLIACQHRVSQASVTPDTTFVHPSKITIVSGVPTSLVETKSVHPSRSVHPSLVKLDVETTCETKY